MADEQMVDDPTLTESAEGTESGAEAAPVDGVPAAEGGEVPATLEVTPPEPKANPWSVRPGLLWGRGLWESAGRLTFMEWNLLVAGTLFALLSLWGASTIKFGPLHALPLGVGLLGLGLVSLVSQWPLLMAWNREPGQSWRAGLFALLE